ncbi:MAG: hypothetical protein KJP18_07865 [Gemmatimonadetes bacterium]|nr:hypothetical protein [Gemmatimonadota bacterium]NNF37084.1 hypothetical protein [Gemmatimonadota bacterium]
MSQQPQSFEHHAKMVPGYHQLATALLVLPTLYFAWTAITDFSLGALATVVFAFGVIVAALYARLFPLGVQDRVIRLEEQLRLARLLPEQLRGRVDEITTDQLIGLRFASDDELPKLVGRVLAGELKDRKSIKAAIQNWRPDHQRI